MIDWQTYADVFPDRYVKPSRSDTLILEELGRRESGRGLDVGGGVHGTRYLWEWASECFLLDPYVRSDLPSVGWDEVRPTFDAIVARGSLNYLSFAQIGILASCVKDGGLLAFNTFVRPAEGQRRYVSRAGSGVERFRPVPGGPFGMMEHMLEPDGGAPVIHWFLYYPVECLRELVTAAGLGCEILESGNTAVFLCRRK